MSIMMNNALETEKWCSIAEEYRAMADNMTTDVARRSWVALAEHAEREAAFAALRHVYTQTHRPRLPQTEGDRLDVLAARIAGRPTKKEDDMVT